ncbi:MAG: NUDIX domain-containing protein [Planctomycetes bacterium]|nr:NUDIX domain-containing protein [Planctomycetota bacterium]
MTAFASGFVLFRRETPFRYLTLRNARHGDIGLPKGHLEPGEGAIEAALRETAEETGITEVRPNRWFLRTVRYPSGGGMKEVAYFAAETSAREVRLSKEHDVSEWRDLDGTIAAIRHGNLRAVVRDAAIFMKDPILRRGLSPREARDLLASRVAENIVAHTAEVAAMARVIGEGSGNPDYVEAAAWLHDIGRAVAHDDRHPLEGFRMVVALGHPGYAPPCLSHYTKGEPDPKGPRYREMSEACDLETFDEAERAIALADALAAGARRVTLEERYEDLARRYGASPFLERNLAICRRLKADFEARTGKDLYGLLGIR